MRDITHKTSTLRTARAVGILFCSSSTLELIQAEKLPKGNLFDVARAAAYLGAKSTPQLLPHCHPVTIDGMELQLEFLAQIQFPNIWPSSCCPSLKLAQFNKVMKYHYLV